MHPTTSMQTVVSDNFDIVVVISLIFFGKLPSIYPRFFANCFYKLSCVIPFDFANFQTVSLFLFCNYSCKFHTHRHTGSMFLQVVISVFFVSYFASESLCSNGILLFAFLLQSVVRDNLFAGVLYWNAFFFANC